ncbi:DUF3105 domain-containing protein [Natronoglycomyces albus]|uniref:DUF3105 domain-containing protein n=1 Tax=Natronoglycomyces albus TaxID=2811108 RepID=A0A895XR09_9ACTN|nr:DUF3105 domain-containing protein [Natronoglycomyces albus]QSB06152.1 DUF3105 domain-containing protein [Natronoglycomyces albus]
MSAKRHPGSKKGKKNGRSVKVEKPKPWGLILTFTGVGVVAVGMVAAAAWVVFDRTKAPTGAEEFFGSHEGYWDLIEAVENGDVDEDDLEHPWVIDGTHVDSGDPNFEPVDYQVTPPVGGPHHSQWQTCTGIVYGDELIDEHAVHSLEHGAVWVTYDPDQVSEDDIETLAGKVQGRDYTMMSPYPAQSAPISLQAWGVQLTTDSATDNNIDRFMQHYLRNNDITPEPHGTCSGGFTGTKADDPMANLTPEELAELEEMMSEGGEDDSDEESSED